MRTMARLFLPILLLSITLFLQPAFANIGPTGMIVNDSEELCADYFLGSQCQECIFPNGWNEIGEGASCPPEYNFIEISLECISVQSAQCCSEYSPGLDCSAMVVNNSLQKCSFVFGRGCNLPQSWEAKPSHIGSSDWFCPEGFSWVSELECLKPVNGQGNGQDPGGGNEFFDSIIEYWNVDPLGEDFPVLVAGALLMGLVVGLLYTNLKKTPESKWY